MALGLALALFLTATVEAGPRTGGRLRIALTGDQRSLDPIQVFTGEEGTLAQLVHRCLIDYTADGRFVPALARRLPSVSSDGRILTFELRDDARFSNGRPLEAPDVVYSLERCLDATEGAIGVALMRSIRGAAAFEAARRQEFESAGMNRGVVRPRWIEPVRLAGVQALDRFTVRIELEQPDLMFLHVLTAPGAGIVPREEVARLGAAFRTHPVGAGPFVLTEWTRGIRMRFDRNPHAYREGEPWVDGVDVLVGLDFTTQAMMFKRGEIDVQWSVMDADYLHFQRDERLRSCINSIAGMLPQYVSLNCELPPFTQRRVRVALNHAIDRSALLRALAGRGVVARGPLARSVKGHHPGLPEYRYDPALARRLLAEAGYPDGFKTTLWVAPDNSSSVKIALLVQEQLRQVGVSAELRQVSGSTFNEVTQRRRAVPMACAGWGATFDDPRDTFDLLLNGDNITDEGCMNLAFYTNPEVSTFLRQAAAEADAARRLNLYHAAEERIVQDAPWIFLVHLNDDHLVQPWIKGYLHRSHWPNARIEQCWLER